MFYRSDAMLPARQERRDIYHYGVKGMKWGVRRTPEQLGHRLPAKQLVAKSSNRSTIVQEAIRSGKVSKQVNREKQLRHTLGGHTKGRSYLYGGVDYAQKLIDELSGTGDPIIVEGIGWTNKERVISSRVIGAYVNPKDDKETEVNTAVIVYSKTGAHIYPAQRKEE